MRLIPDQIPTSTQGCGRGSSRRSDGDAEIQGGRCSDGIESRDSTGPRSRLTGLSQGAKDFDDEAIRPSGRRRESDGARVFLRSGEVRRKGIARTIEVEVFPPGLVDRPASRAVAGPPCQLPGSAMPAFFVEPVEVAVSRGRFGWSWPAMVDVDHPASYHQDLSMRTATLAAGIAKPRTTLRLHAPAADIAGAARWLINGYPATILIWTAEEWSRLPEQPGDAQACANGTWCALRFD
jgi:hypothetical protein